MKIYIEVAIILILLFMFLFWKIWFKWSERRLKKKYKPENDKGRKGIIKGTIETTEFGTGESTNNSNGYEQSERRKFLQKTSTNNIGRNKSSDRKIRRIFRRRQS